jgi:hypothetical protein
MKVKKRYGTYLAAHYHVALEILLPFLVHGRFAFDLLQSHFFFWRWMGVLGSIALGWVGVGLGMGWD